jgi:hypothetical protein
MLPNLNSHIRHLSTFHSLPIILRLQRVHINLHTCRLAHYARSVKISAAGLPSTYDSRFRYSCSAYDADTLRFRCLRLFATASRFQRMISACIYHLRRSSDSTFSPLSTQRFLLTTITDVAISTGDCAFGLQLDQRFWPQVSACFRCRFLDTLRTFTEIIVDLEFRSSKLRALPDAISAAAFPPRISRVDLQCLTDSIESC